MHRREFFLSQIKKSDPIIEIGPSISPIAPKGAGWNSTVIDHADTAKLIEKYTTIGSDVKNIETVDKVWASGRLDQAFTPQEHGIFRAIIASHAIEHLPDPITFLQSSQNLLHPEEGRILLAVPDKRNCFDVFKPLTCTFDWIENFRNLEKTHTSKSVFNHIAYYSESNNKPSWNATDEFKPTLTHSINFAYGITNDYTNEGRTNYFDVHAWNFTPSSFELIIYELSQIRLINFSLEKIEKNTDSEFLASLKIGTTIDSEEISTRKRKNLLQKIKKEISNPDTTPDSSKEKPIDLTTLQSDILKIRKTSEDLDKILHKIKAARNYWRTIFGRT